MVVVPGPDILGLIVENIGGGEVVVIAFLALVILGPERIPEMARSAGRLINKVRTMSSDLSGEMSDVINDPSMQPIRELGEFATRPRQKLAEYALEAEAEERQRRTEAGSGSDRTPGTSGTTETTAPSESTAPSETTAPSGTTAPSATPEIEDATIVSGDSAGDHAPEKPPAHEPDRSGEPKPVSDQG